MSPRISKSSKVDLPEPGLASLLLSSVRARIELRSSQEVSQYHRLDTRSLHVPSVVHLP